jgi:hypothetical protein
MRLSVRQYMMKTYVCGISIFIVTTYEFYGDNESYIIIKY